MLRKLWFAALAALMPVESISAYGQTPGDPAEAMSKPVSVTSTAGKKSIEDLYLLCAFYPKVGTCEDVYRRAMKDDSITAQAVRAEYMGYARYLHGSSGLSESDYRYLKENSIRVPAELNAVNRSGLHNVIHDETLKNDEKRAAVNGFLSRAVQAELYCGFNKCEELEEKMATVS